MNPDGSIKWKVSEPGSADWRFVMIGGDGTIYAFYADGIDANFYALRPDKSIRWVINPEFNPNGPQTIGPDGTIYILDGEIVNAIGLDSPTASF